MSNADTTTMDALIAMAREYSDALDRLDEVVGEIEDEQRSAVRRRMRSLRARASASQRTREKLVAAIGAADPALFEKPRTRIAHGVKFGLRRAAGRLSLAGGQTAAGAIAAVREHLPDRSAECVQVKESLVAAAVRKLSQEQRRVIGVEITDASETPVASRVVPSAERLASALIDGADTEEAQGEA